jgi:predicted amino acid dehydrogenase
MKFFLPFLINIICRHAPPLIASEITGLISNKGIPIKGWLLICPLTTQQLLNNRKLGKKKIKSTISLAEKLGAKIVGLGAITSSITAGGRELLGDIKIGITNGRTLTVGISIIGIKKAAEIKKLDLSRITMAIVGAAGSIGEAISKLMIKEKVKRFILVDKDEKLESLIQLKKEMLKMNSSLEIEFSSKIHSIKNAEIVVVATNSPKVLINSEDLKYKALIYDVTQPQNVSQEIAQNRKDVIIIDGGLVRTPGINYNFDLGLPPETAFACLAETLLLAAEGKYNCSLVGKVKLERVEEILELAKRYKFTHAPLTSFGKPIFLNSGE